MDDLDAALANLPVAAPTLAGAVTPRKHRHEWNYFQVAGDVPQKVCRFCGAIRDEARSRRGKSARQRGNAYERELAKKLGGKRTGHFGGPDDVTVNDLFTIQSKVRKAFPTWMTDELAKLPRTGGRIPLLVVADSPGAAYKRTAIVVVGLADWISLHGPTEVSE